MTEHSPELDQILDNMCRALYNDWDDRLRFTDHYQYGYTVAQKTYMKRDMAKVYWAAQSMLLQKADGTMVVIKPRSCGKSTFAAGTSGKLIENDSDAETEAGKVYSGPATFFRGDISLKEGSMQKGGVKPPPTTPRPGGTPGGTLDCVMAGTGRPSTALERWLSDKQNSKHQWSTERGALRNGDLYALAEAIYETLKEQK